MTAVDIPLTPPAERVTVSRAARFEAARMLRHPLTWLGVALSVWLGWEWLGEGAPILPADSIWLAGAVLPLASTTLLVANQATLRQRRLAELLPTYPGDRTRATRGVQVALIAPVLLAVVLQMIGLVWLWLGGPIGRVDWLELVAGPLAVATSGLLGVVVGSRLPHPIAAPSALLGLVVLNLLAHPDIGFSEQFCSNPDCTPVNVEWLVPWMPGSVNPGYWTERPIGANLVWSAGVATLLVMVALPSTGRRRAIRAGLGIVIGIFAVLTAPQLPTETHHMWGSADQNCEVLAGRTYCALPGFAPWAERWSETIETVAAILPVPIDTVLQLPPVMSLPTDGDVAEGLAVATTEWDRKGAVPEVAFDFALVAGHSAVGLPAAPQLQPPTEDTIDDMLEHNPGLSREQVVPMLYVVGACSSINEARAVVSVWAAAAALERGDMALDRIIRRTPPGTVLPSSLRINRPVEILRGDAELASDLLTLPVEQVQEALVARWADVIDPATTSDELAGWFGLPTPPRIDSASLWVSPPCP